jgi:hypothetical protein
VLRSAVAVAEHSQAIYFYLDISAQAHGRMVAPSLISWRLTQFMLQKPAL